MAILIAWGVVALLATLGLAQALVEWRALRRLVALTHRPDKLKRAVAGLSQPYRSVFSEFIEGLHRQSTLDEALTRALLQSAHASFAPAIALHGMAVAATVIAVLTPAVVALEATAARIADLFADARAQSARTRYLNGSDGLHPSFVELGQAFEGTALVLAALVLVWAFRWWVLRPEVREARLVKTLIECAGRLRPGARAPVSTRLAELIAPEKGITRPTIAAALWLGAVTIGWLALIGAANLRAQNLRPKPFNVWPTGTERPIEPYHNVILPRGDAGAPIAKSQRPSLTVAPDAVVFHNTSLLNLVDGRLPQGWLEASPPMDKSLADFPRPLEVTVLGHRDARLETLVAVLRGLSERYQVARYHLIIERRVALFEGKRLQASFPIELAKSADTDGLTLLILDNGVRLMPSRAFAPFGAKRWVTDLRGQIRGYQPLWADPRPSVTVDADLRLNYGRMIDVISAADGSCPTPTDCGLPGLGLIFMLAP